MAERILLTIPSGIDLYSGPSPDSDLVETGSENLRGHINLNEQDLETGAVVIRTEDGQKRYRLFPDTRTERIQKIMTIAKNTDLLTPKQEMVAQGLLETLLFYGRDPQT
ncbi:MAG: hypothetical protein AAB546_01015 [Patescibacteria group bacterium]